MNKNIQIVESNKKNAVVIHSFIPKFCSDEFDANQLYTVLQHHNILFFNPPPQLDISRDGHHYDVNTATSYCNLYLDNLK